MSEVAEDEFYEISAVARLTGLSTHVLRMWERRYGVVEPDRTDTKRRRYIREDIHRLTLLKSLVDNGHTISSIAKLDISSLEDRLSKVLASKPSIGSDTAVLSFCRIGMVAVQSRHAVRDAADAVEELSVCSECSSVDEMICNNKAGVIDLLIIEMASLFDEDVKKIQKAIKELGARRAIVIFHYSSEQVLEPQNMVNITALHAPVIASEILLACAADISFTRKLGVTPAEQKQPIDVSDSVIPDRIFTAEQLVALTKKASAVHCECPRHMSQLLEAMSAFEEYSRQCESRNSEDAELHAFLHRQTAECRFKMEQALEKVIEAEGITI